MTKIIVFGSHPDDAEFGMGGTIAKFVKKGYDVCVFIARECTRIRKKEQINSGNILGCTFIKANFSFTSETEMSEIGTITNFIKESEADKVYFPWEYDSNQHHRKLSKMVMSALRRTDINCYMYDSTTIKGVTSETFKSHIYEDITKYFSIKIKAIKCHKLQLTRLCGDKIDFIKYKDAYNGHLAGVEFAEVFQIVKEIKR